MNDTPFISISNVKKHFQISRSSTLRAVDGISLDIFPHEVIGLVGESGCGKSTLGRTIVGLYERNGGDITIGNYQVPTRCHASDFRKLSRRVQMIFQDPYSSLNPRMTVKEIIAEGPLLHKLWDPRTTTERVGEWLKKVGLHPDHMSRYPHEFSGGQRQRIGIARALVLEPQFLICDEPISALDVSVQAQIVNLLADLRVSMGLTILFIAHDLSMIRFISDRVVVMYLGTVVEQGTKAEVFENPKHPYTQLLLASNPKPDPKSQRTRNHAVLQGEIGSPINVGPGCRFAARCPLVTDHCRAVTPLPHPVSDSHLVACHLVVN